MKTGAGSRGWRYHRVVRELGVAGDPSPILQPAIPSNRRTRRPCRRSRPAPLETRSGRFPAPRWPSRSRVAWWRKPLSPAESRAPDRRPPAPWCLCTCGSSGPESRSAGPPTLGDGPLDRSRESCWESASRRSSLAPEASRTSGGGRVTPVKFHAPAWVR